MSVAVIVLTLLVTVVASWFSLWKLYSIMRRIEKQLSLVLRQQPEKSDSKVGNANDTSH